MAERSWQLLEHEAEEHRLPAAWRATDPGGAVDCGWVEPMRLLLRSFSQPGAAVLDPFAGFGTTLVACALEGRRGLGIEVEPSRVALARQRLASPVYATLLPQRLLEGNARSVRLPAASVDLCLTSVPYFGFRCPPLTTAPGQLYSADAYARYLDGLDEVFRQVCEALTEGGQIVALAENIRLPGGLFVPLAWDVARVLARRLTLHEERLMLYHRPLPDDPDPHRTNRSHEYVLVASRDTAGVDLTEAAQLLTDLAGRNVRFVVVGSLARHWLAATAQGRPPHDVDILVPNDSATLNRLVAYLTGEGFAVHSWDEPISAPVEMDLLRGRYYLRAVRVSKVGSRLVLDATYESPLLAFSEAWQQRIQQGAIPIAHPQDLDRFQWPRCAS